MDELTSDEMLQLTNENGERLEALRFKKISVDVQQLMIRHLIETLFPTDEERAELHFSFQKRLSEIITQAEENADQLLLQASAQPSGLLVPNR